MSFRRHKSLGDYLLHSKLKRTNHTEPRPTGTVRCESGRRQVYQHLEPGDTFTSHITRKKYSINYELNFNSSNVVYSLSCKVCQIQYMGSTKTKFRFRFNDNKSRLRAYTRLSDGDKNKDNLINGHFNAPGSGG